MTILKDLCTLIVDCEHKTAPAQNAGYPSIRTPNIGRGRLLLDGVNRVSEETYRLWTQREVPKPGDLILAREAPIGNVAIIPPGLNVCLGQRTVLIRPNGEKVNAQYLTYLLLGDEIQGRIQSLSNGATVHHLNMADIRNLDIPPLPSPKVQDQIASILSAYDDLIENNTRRIRLLEEMAQMMYREWFVNFRFPGHEKVRMVESEMGSVPKGWRVQKVTEAIEIDPITKVPKEGMKPFVSMGSLSHTSMIITDIEERKGNSGSKFQNGDTLFARITPCLENGKTGFVQFLSDCGAVGFGSTEFIVLRSRTVNPEYVYLMARSEQFRENAIKSMSGATGRQRVQERCFDKFLIAHPPVDLLQAFQNTVMPMFRLTYALSLKNGNLRRTRDLLLPKLISGQIDIEQSEAEAVAEAAV
jgi:type I restriction enzyme, S subunit